MYFLDISQDVKECIKVLEYLIEHPIEEELPICYWSCYHNRYIFGKSSKIEDMKSYLEACHYYLEELARHQGKKCNTISRQARIFSLGRTIYFPNERPPYIVMAVSDRYAVVSRRLNRIHDAELLHHEVEMGAYSSFTEAYNHNKDTPVYSLIDFKENKRSSDDLVFGIFDYFKEEDCKEAIKYLEEGKMGLSDRNITELSGVYEDWRNR